MKPEFSERLYRGYAAEHHISSQLFRYGFEVFRLPADFGLDLVVTNQFQVAKKGDGKPGSFPFALQVKSRWLKPAEVTKNSGGRPTAVFNYQLKTDEVTTVIEQGNAGIAFVFYWPAGSGFHPSFFWLHATHLLPLIDMGFLRDIKAKLANGTVEQRYELAVRYTLLPRQTRAAFIKELDGEFKLSHRLKAKLERELPEQFLRNWNASAYLALGRTSRTGDNQIVFRTPGFVSFDFVTFPTYKPFVDPG